MTGREEKNASPVPKTREKIETNIIAWPELRRPVVFLNRTNLTTLLKRLKRLYCMSNCSIVKFNIVFSPRVKAFRRIGYYEVCSTEGFMPKKFLNHYVQYCKISFKSVLKD